MAFIPSKNASNISSQALLELNLILEIEGIPIIFGSQNISKFWKFDEGFILDTEGLRFDSPFQDPKSRDYISLKKTSKTISQQVFPSRGGTSSTMSIDIELVDFNGEVTEILKSGNNVEDLIGQRASTFIGFKSGAHSEDSIPLLDGYIQKIKPVHGGYVLTIAHSENKKRQDLFEVYTDTLSVAINNSTTSLTVSDTSEIIQSSDSLIAYIQIDDEIMEVSSVVSGTQLTVIRSRLNTFAIDHDIQSNVSSVYGLSGNAIDLSLKLYLSGGDEYYNTLSPSSFNQIGTDLIQDTIFFNEINLVEQLNVTILDIITITGASNVQNNGEFIVNNITTISTGSYITVTGANFITEDPTNASISFKSQYNVFNTGCGLTPFDVDIQTHLDELNENSASFPSYQFYLKEEIDAKSFVDTQLYYPSGLYSIIRNAKIGCRFTKPPLADNSSPTFNSKNIININNIKIERSTTKFMFNSVVFKYDKSVVDENFKAGFISTNPIAKNRTDKSNHTLRISSDGLRRTGETFNLIDRQTKRFYQRYQYGAKLYSNIQVLFSDSWTLEVGDIIEFGGNDLKIPDLDSGTTYTPKRLLEIINISRDITSGVMTFSCLETGFDLGSRFAVFSPSSIITSNSTTSKLELTLSFDTGKFINERQKWEQYVGSRIRVRSEDYTFDEIVTIDSLAPENDEVLNITPSLSSVSAGLIVEIPKYDESSSSVDAEYKSRYAYRGLSSLVTVSTSSSVFSVTDGSKFKAGGLIQVRSNDYSTDSGEDGVEILSISLNVITLKNSLSFVPAVNYVVQKLSYLDDGFSYRYI